MIVVDVSHEEKVDNPRILALCVIINDESPLQLAKAINDSIDHPIDANYLADHGFQLRKQRVVCVGAVYHLATLLCGFQKLGFGQLVEFFSDRIGRNVKFLGKFPEVGFGFGIKEKTDQQFDPCF